MNKLTLWIGCSLFLAGTGARADAPQYEANLIRRPDNDIPQHAPITLNDRGQILLDSFSRTPYVLDTDADSLFLPVPEWKSFWQMDVSGWNDSAEMCGFHIEETGNPWIPFFWDGAALHDLEPKEFAVPLSVTDQGLVYGLLSIFGSSRAAAWNGGGDAIILDPIAPYPAETWSRVIDGNAQGDLIGSMLQTTEDLPIPRGLMWAGGAAPLDLGAPPTSTDGTTEVWAINDSLWVVGAATGDDPETPTGKGWHAHVWRDGVWTDIHDNAVLNPAGNSHFSIATAVNNAGTIGGKFISGFGPVYTAFLWADDQMYVIDDLITNADDFEQDVHIRDVMEINARGDILTSEYFLRRIAPASEIYVVNTTNNLPDTNPGDGICLTADGNCSLRAAIEDANIHEGRERIEFNIPEDDENCTDGLCTITPNPELPIIQTPMIIDATTQPVYTGTPLIILDGTASRETGADHAGIHISGDSTEVTGFSIGNWGKEGILISGDRNKIMACYSGLHPDGDTGIGNNGEGVLIDGGALNIIGGRTVAKRCVITNNGRGILEGETTGQQVGIEKAAATGNRIEGNYLGTTANGTATLPNPPTGVSLSRECSGNIIGGEVEAARNIISGHRTGIECTTAQANIIQGNFIGLNATGTDRLPNLGVGILVADSRDTIVGGPSDFPGAPPGNVISGNRNGSRTIAHGIWVVTASHATVIQGNLIGTDANGRFGIGNEGAGIHVLRSDSVRVGGADLGEGNVIAANDSSGVLIVESRNASIQGNGIGVDLRGRVPLPNGDSGVLLRLSEDNLIGGIANTPGSRPGNVISGNSRVNHLVNGVHLSQRSHHNTIQGNVIGLNRNGNAALANGGHGIFLDHVDSTSVGALDERGRNVISGNDWSGLYASGCTGTKVFSNYIGTNSFATADFGNGLDGITLADTTSKSDIDLNLIQGNLRNGLRVVSGEQNNIEHTRFFRNRFLGIELSPQGVTTNDWKDVDTGANQLQNFPMLQWARENADSNAVHLIGSLAGKTNTEYRLDFFANSRCHESGHGEGENRWIEDLLLETDATGYLAFDLWLDLNLIGARPDFMAATATDPDGNTSEFSNCLAILPPPPPPANGVPFIVNSTGDLGDTAPGDGRCSTGGVIGAELECTLRAAIEETNALAGEQTVLFSIPETTLVILPASPLPVILGPLQINAQTQPGFIGQPIITLDGSAAGTTAGLELQGTNVDLRGLIVQGFSGEGLSLQDGGFHVIQGNVIGILGNNGSGVGVASSGNRIGGPGIVQGNRIIGNGGDGIRVASGTGNAFTNNGLTDNEGLGINLSGGIEDTFGVTENDATDKDAGPNDLQNAPELTSVEAGSDLLLVEGTLRSLPNQNYEIALYASPDCDPSGFGEGETFLGSLGVTTDGEGLAAFSAELGLEFSGSDPEDFEMATVTATATNEANSTSEFSPCLTPVVVPVVLLYFQAHQDEGAPQGVTLRWQIAADFDLRGFHLSRRVVGEMDWTRITDTTLQGQLAFEFHDSEGMPNHEYLLEGISGTGEPLSLGNVTVQETLPAGIAFRVFPNPITRTGTVAFALPKSALISLRVFDVQGRLVRTLAEGPYPAGGYEIEWNGRDSRDSSLGSGAYWIELRMPGTTRSSKVVLLP